MGSQHPSTPESNDIAKLWELIKDMRFGMLTTRHENGHLHSRPMTTQNRRDDEADALFFFMSRSSEPFADLQREHQVNVAYANPSSDTYVSVSGLAEAVEDPALRRALWNTATQASSGIAAATITASLEYSPMMGSRSRNTAPPISAAAATIKMPAISCSEPNVTPAGPRPRIRSTW